MNFKEMIDNMSPEVYASLKQAVELGKWPNGVRLTPEQKELSLQAVITYDYSNKSETERVGYINTEVHSGCDSKQSTAEHETIKWVDNSTKGNN
ncbi:YeaC family protein [Marinomonas dokdonensis]|uniref:YeaC family protein n=1 Tax=Marinomonas dokdonensis TaxID=328224 RepID=UPI00405598CD